MKMLITIIAACFISTLVLFSLDENLARIVVQNEMNTEVTSFRLSFPGGEREISSLPAGGTHNFVVDFDRTDEGLGASFKVKDQDYSFQNIEYLSYGGFFRMVYKIEIHEEVNLRTSTDYYFKY